MKTLCLILLTALTACSTIRASRICHPAPATAAPPATVVPMHTSTLKEKLTWIDIRHVCGVEWMGMCYSMREPAPLPRGNNKLRKWLSSFHTGGCAMADEPLMYGIMQRGVYTIYCQPDDSLRTYTVPEQLPGQPKEPFIGRSTEPKPNAASAALLEPRSK